MPLSLLSYLKAVCGLNSPLGRGGRRSGSGVVPQVYLRQNRFFMVSRALAEHRPRSIALDSRL
jgi:hypothetical protein